MSKFLFTISPNMMAYVEQVKLRISVIYPELEIDISDSTIVVKDTNLIDFETLKKEVSHLFYAPIAHKLSEC
jgi:hypothetical protein